MRLFRYNLDQEDSFIAGKGIRYKEEQIIRILKEVENGTPVAEVCRQNGLDSHCHWSNVGGGAGQSPQVEFYVDRLGRSPAVEFLRSLPKHEQAEALRVIDLLKEFGVVLGMPHARQIAGLR